MFSKKTCRTIIKKMKELLQLRIQYVIFLPSKPSEILGTPSWQSQTETVCSEFNEPACSLETEIPPNLTSSCSGNNDCPEFDIDKWLDKSSSMTRPQKLDQLKNRWAPPKNYDFHKDKADSRMADNVCTLAFVFEKTERCLMPILRTVSTNCGKKRPGSIHCEAISEI